MRGRTKAVGWTRVLGCRALSKSARKKNLTSLEINLPFYRE